VGTEGAIVDWAGDLGLVSFSQDAPPVGIPVHMWKLRQNVPKDVPRAVTKLAGKGERDERYL